MVSCSWPTSAAESQPVGSSISSTRASSASAFRISTSFCLTVGRLPTTRIQVEHDAVACQQRQCLLALAAAVEPAEAARGEVPKVEVVQHRHLGQQIRVLVDAGHAAAQHLERPAQRGRSHRRPALPAVGHDGAGEDLHQRRLARAVRTDQRAHLAGSDTEVRGLQNRLRAVDLGHRAGADREGRFHHPGAAIAPPVRRRANQRACATAASRIAPVRICCTNCEMPYSVRPISTTPSRNAPSTGPKQRTGPAAQADAADHRRRDGGQLQPVAERLGRRGQPRHQQQRRDAGTQARQRVGKNHVAVHVDAGQASRLCIAADRHQRLADAGARQHRLQHHEDHDRDDERQRDAGKRERIRQAERTGDVERAVEADDPGSVSGVVDSSGRCWRPEIANTTPR